MKNKNKLLFSILKTGIFISVVFLIAFLILRTYEIKPTTAAPVPIDCSVGSPRNIAQGADFNSGDDLTLYGNGTCVLTTTASVNSLVIGSVGGDTTVLTHPDNSTAQTYSIDITITNDVTLYSGASIDVDGLGYDGSGSGHADGYGPGAGLYVTSSTGGGAGHGGNGGTDHEGEGSGTAYCDISDVATIGSGGAGGYGGGTYDGSDGGGLIMLDAGGTVTIDGTITADSPAVTTNYAGGGAGGGIKISADTIAGTPTSFTATGGNSLYQGGGGGGGCILLEYATPSSVLDVSAIDVYGGTAGSGGQYGGGGQVLIHDTDLSYGNLFIENNGTEGADSTQDTAANSLTVNSVTVSNEANYLVPNGESLTVNNSFGGDGTGLLKVSGDLDNTAGNDYDGLTVSILSGGILSNTATINITSDGGLILGDGGTADTVMNTVNTAGTLGLDRGATFSMADLNISSGTTTLYSYTSASSLSLDDLVMTGGTLTHGDNYTAQTNVVNISASSANIGAAASINVDGLGYDGSESGHADGYGPGAGLYVTSSTGGGAGHGGDGGTDQEGEGSGATYCDISDVVTIGSGGAGGYGGGTYDGSDGGGLIILDVGGTVTIDGTITADSPATPFNYAGGGAGGGVKITADTIAGTPTSFTVTGGNANSQGGGGGGGCVLLEYTTSTTISDVSGIDIYGGSAASGGQYGGGGQVLIKQDGTNGDLFVENNGTEGADTGQIPNPFSIDSVTISSLAKYVVPNGSAMTVNDVSPFGGDDTGTLEIAGSLTFTTGSDYDNLDVSVVSGGEITSAATLNIIDDGGLLLGDGATANTPITAITTAGTLEFDDGAAFSLTDLTITGGTTTLNNYTALSSLSIDDLIMTGGILTHGDNFDAQDHVLNIAANSVNIGISASVNVDGVGYEGGISGHVNGYGPGAGIEVLGSTGPGGGHGGDGGADSSGDPGGSAYCDISNPATIGSGGAAGYSGGGYEGGLGGGLIIFDVTNTITIDGTITADAPNVVVNYAGGGAGGGIKISADTIAGSPTSLTATGGNAWNTGGGGGGGGCILLEYATANSVGIGDVSVIGGSDGGGSGDPGSDGLFDSIQLTPSAPTTLYSHSTDASAGDSNPTNITDLTPVFSAICNTPSGDCITADVEVDNDSDFSSTLWSDNVDIADVADGVRSGNITYAGSQLLYNTTYYWRIRFYNTNGAGNWSSTEATFYAPRAIELYNFDQGGTVGQGQEVPIQWGSYGGEINETVNIHYSTDGFVGSDVEVTPSVASTSAPEDIKSYTWIVPNISSNSVKLRICSNNDGSNTCYASEDNFTIQADPGSLPTSRNFYNDGLYTVDSGISYAGGNAQFSYPANWYDTDWASRKKITFTSNNSLLPATQTNFPALISLSYDYDLASDAQNDYDDILFTSSAGVKLNHEVEYFNEATGELVAWVNIPSLALGTEIYMYYGNDTVGSQENISGTWSEDGNFEAVWHLDETSGNIDDSANSDTATPTSVTQDVSGPTWLDGADTFDGSSSFHSVTSGANTDFTNESFTISSWIYSDSDDAGVIFDNRYDIAGTDTGWMFGLSGDTNNRTIVFDINGDNDNDTTETDPASYTTGEWQLLSVVKDGTDGHFYRNGSLLQTISLGTSGTVGYDVAEAWHNIGKLSGTYYDHQYDIPNQYFNGSMDELRISSTNRDANWIKAAYSNQSDPSTFYTLDSEVNVPSSTEQRAVFDVSHSFYSAYDFNATSSGTGEVRYQISDDDGATWNYCVGDVLTVAADNYAQTNTAAGITNGCLANLSSGGEFNVRAYMHANSGETATLSDMYFTLATSYNAINSASEKTDGTGVVDLDLELDDLNTSDTLSTKLEYRAGVDCSAGTSDPTLDTTIGSYGADSGTPTINNGNEYQVGNVSVVDVGTNTVQFDWLSATDVPAADATYCVKVTTHDGMVPSSSATTTLTLDNVDPIASGNLTVNSKNDTSITYTLGAAGNDTNLNQYAIYYKQGASGVTEADTLGSAIASGSYIPGNTTQITSLSPNTQYVTNIWTNDNYGHVASATELASYTHAEIPGQPTISNLTTDSFDITLGNDNNPAYTTYAIQVSDGTDFYYIQADGTLGSTEAWQTKAAWNNTTVTGLDSGTSYAAHVKARNEEGIETAFDGTDSGTTDTEDEQEGQEEEEVGGDTTPPSITNLTPEEGATKISPNTTISFNVRDGGSGVDIGTLRTTVIGSKSGTHKNVLRAFDGNASNFEVTLIPEKDFAVNEQVTLEIRVRDYAQNQTILSDHVFLIEPAQEPTIENLTEDSEITEIWRAQTVKTEEELEVEQSQGIIDDGANIEVGDLTYDGTKEIVTTPRAGVPYVRIYSKEGFILTPPFLAYDKSYANGVNVAIGDLHGTGGEQEIVTSPMDGAAHIRIFNKDGQVLNSFFAREDSFRGNSIVKIANLEGPDRDSGDLEIIILFSDGILKVFNRDGKEIMAPVQAFLPYLQNTENVKDILFDLGVVDIENNGGAKEVIVSDHNTIIVYGKDQETKKLKQIVPDIIPFESTSLDYNKGIVFSVVDIDGTRGEREIVVGSKTGSSIVKFFNKDGQKIKPDFYAYDPNYYGGIDLEVADLDGTDGPSEIITIAQNYSAHVRIFNKDGEPITSGFMAYPEHTDGKTRIQAANLNNEELQGGPKNKDLIVTPIQGPTHARFYSKDSELLTEGFYIVGVGTKIEVGE